MHFSELLEPQRTGPFRTFAVLGEGGMGRVLLGVSPDGRLVAVKQVLADLADDDGFRARFRREVAASRRVSGAYTASVLDADADAPVPWPASAFVPGPTLSQVLEAVRTLLVPSVRQLAAGLAQALADIHRAGLIHRDLKPSNVLLAEDGVRVIRPRTPWPRRPRRPRYGPLLPHHPRPGRAPKSSRRWWRPVCSPWPEPAPGCAH
ncbi:protein kinase domain-containing protein [Streptomyces sp. NRRL S-1521]|uniref:protein kinase domain-containing protein n=1 Tax=Streptomyces sp. NRRL S-1521 TaxID=1609100 RepID=UPI00074B1B79|nr:protein kinase [Streptomyces sp. NRRL S-1521]KUL63342.1 hypothetical protein ADL30_03405 [Streptomyces sp. NRRL S-1521]